MEVSPPGDGGMALALPSLAPAGVGRGRKREQGADPAGMEDDPADGEGTPRSSKARSSNWTGEENAAMDALGYTSREEAMEVLREKCQHDTSELYSPPPELQRRLPSMD